jgi:hypothetical protein
MNIKNTFSKGTVNKDMDGRFVSSDELTDAENFFVTTVDGSSAGVGKNALGNVRRTFAGIEGGITVGCGKNPSNNKIYNLVKGNSRDYIIEYDINTHASEIVSQSTTGTRWNFRAGERVRNVEVLMGNTDADTLLKISGDSNPPRIINIARAKTWGLNGFTAEEIMLIKAPPLYPPVVVQVQAVQEQENFMKEKFISFATRYKYKDNYYSAISTWQEYPFAPDKFQLDFATLDNKGMINTYNACDVTFQTGPREVIAIDLLFRYSNSTTVYKVDQYIKEEEGWGDNTSIPAPIRFSNSKVFSVLPEDQYFRTQDNVPESNVAATFAGNREFLANYKEQKNLIDKDGNPVVMDFTVDFSSIESDGEFVGANKKSMKSYRSYEVVVFYKDPQGRKTTGLSSANNTVFIPISKSASKNTLTVDMSGFKPPVGYATYGFAIKQNKIVHDTIYCTTFYVDGQFVWVKLLGTNVNKVKVDDVLLVKKDINNDTIAIPVTTTVLEIKVQDKDFITGNIDKHGNEISEESGTYMRLKPEGYELKYIGDEFNPYNFSEKSKSVPQATITIPTTVPTSIPAGSKITFNIHSSYRSDREVNDYNKDFTASSDYANFGDFYNAQIAMVAFQGTNTGVRDGGIFQKSATADSITIRGTSAGNGNYNAFISGTITVRTLTGVTIFETTPIDVNNGYFETPDVFDIINGEHVENGVNVVNGVHSLVHTFNCFTQQNGAESAQIRDVFNEKYVEIDYLPIGVSNDVYQQVNRPCDITYSGVYNPNTNVNKLNEFNLYLANFKDDIDKNYGAIYKIKGEETNLQVFQESKDSQVFIGKDFLYNADGTSNLTKTNEVLGKGQDVYKGEFGIAIHSDSYDDSGFNSYHTDVNKGAVIKKSNNGLFEISSQGMTSYFKTLFRDNEINHINGKYDQFNGFYYLNIQYNINQYVTWVYSDKDNGWLGRITFNPEDMCCVNGKFFSFKNGEIYEHNQLTGRNTFYGVESDSKFSFNFSQLPSERKIYKTLEIEGTDSWDLALKTDLDDGYVNASDFEKQEGVFRAYTRVSNDVIDTSTLSCQGIGNCLISGLILSFNFLLESFISIGDEIRNSSKELVGTVTDKTINSLTLDTVNNIVSGDFVMCSKPQSIENQGLLGYHMEVTATLAKNTKTEVYAIGSEVEKSSV